MGKRGEALDDAVLGAASRDHARRSQCLAGNGRSLVVGLSLQAKELDDKRQETANNQQNECNAGAGHEGNLPAPGKGDYGCRDKGAGEFEKHAELLGDAELQGIRGGRDCGCCGTGRHRVEDVDALGKKALEEVQTD